MNNVIYSYEKIEKFCYNNDWKLDNLSEIQIVHLLDNKIIEELKRENCEFESMSPRTSHLDYDDPDAISIWTSYINISYDSKIKAIYLVTNQELKDAGEDLGNVNWIVDHYEIF